MLITQSHQARSLHGNVLGNVLAVAIFVQRLQVYYLMRHTLSMHLLVCLAQGITCVRPQDGTLFLP